jgi:hypothetical protein
MATASGLSSRSARSRHRSSPFYSGRRPGAPLTSAADRFHIRMFPIFRLDEVIMNVCRVTPRKIAHWAANSETDANWIVSCLAQIDTVLTSVSRRWRRRWCAGWLATVFVADHRGERDYLTEHSGWSKRAALRWIEDDLAARRGEAPLGGAEGCYYVATLDKFPPPPQGDAQSRPCRSGWV